MEEGKVEVKVIRPKTMHQCLIQIATCKHKRAEYRLARAEGQLEIMGIYSEFSEDEEFSYLEVEGDNGEIVFSFTDEEAKVSWKNNKGGSGQFVLVPENVTSENALLLCEIYGVVKRRKSNVDLNGVPISRKRKTVESVKSALQTFLEEYSMKDGWRLMGKLSPESKRIVLVRGEGDAQDRIAIAVTTARESDPALKPVV